MCNLYNPKKWLMPNIDYPTALRISKDFGVSMLCANVLCARGIGYDDAKSILNTDESYMHDPFLLNDMHKAVERINIALKKKEKIAVYGDYDVDGITATYILSDYLNSLGADVISYIPDRLTEGYGLNTDAIDILNKRGVSLIITVDVGITAISEVDYAKSLNIDLIVTDHHALKEKLPDALAVINPKIPTANYPFDALAGVGVAFKLIYAHSGLDKNIFEKYCDVVAIGTVADMVPLKDENRYIVSRGILRLHKTSNAGIKSIITVAGLKQDEITSSDISFAIAPRLNAPGRISQASDSVKLLTETDEKKAYEMAEQLDFFNKERQKIEQKIFEECIHIIEQKRLYDNSFILVSSDGWAHGIIGIVSSKITEKYYKPSAVVSINPDGTGKASGRSIRGINLFEALSACSESLTKFGGHELAAGFTIQADKLNEFEKSINEVITPLINEETRTPVVEVDSLISLEDIDIANASSLSVLEPYGVGNRTPLFCIEDIKIENIRYTENHKHAFITVSNGYTQCEFPAFSMTDTIKEFSKGDYISVVGNLSINSFRGVTRAQFIIRDIKFSKKNKLITRDELKCIFTDIKNKLTQGISNFEYDMMFCLSAYRKIRFVNPKIKTALKIFSELEILNIETRNNGCHIEKGKNFDLKTNLTDSSTYREYGV